MCLCTPWFSVVEHVVYVENVLQLACCVLVSQVNAASNKLAVYLPSAPASGAAPWNFSEHEQASAVPSQLVALRAAWTPEPMGAG